MTHFHPPLAFVAPQSNNDFFFQVKMNNRDPERMKWGKIIKVHIKKKKQKDVPTAIHLNVI